jgi:hypothetical protein
LKHHEASNGAPRRVLVVGASADRRKYGNRAVRAYRAAGWRVLPVNLKASPIEGLRTYASVLEAPGPADRASIYLPPEKVLEVLPDLARAGVREVFLNPGSESDAAIALAAALGLHIVLACSIVAIGGNPGDPD